MMTAVVRQGTGRGDIGLEERPIPIAKENDVIVRVRAAGLCGSDINIYQGRPTSAKVGVILGHEFSGDIVQVGSHVTQWKPGDRVVSDNTGVVCGSCFACSQGEYLMCRHRQGLGFQLDGGFAQYVRIPGEGLQRFPNCLMKLPDQVSYDEAAILDPYANAYNALLQQGKMMAGDRIMVTGAGPLALACIDVARAAGASQIINIVRSSTAKIHRAASRELGASVILESDQDDFAQYVLDLTDGEGIPIVLDTAGSNSLYAPCIQLLRRGGKLIKIGYDWSPLQQSFLPTINKNISIIGHMGYNPTAWKQILALLAANKLHPSASISEIMPLMAFHQAVAKTINREVIKVVFHP